jgi:hypothetical protein
VLVLLMLMLMLWLHRTARPEKLHQQWLQPWCLDGRPVLLQAGVATAAEATAVGQQLGTPPIVPWLTGYKCIRDTACDQSRRVKDGVALILETICRQQSAGVE